MSLHDKIVGYIDDLARSLSLFERWIRLFDPKDYPELAASIEYTCTEFFGFLVDSIRFFRRSSLGKFS